MGASIQNTLNSYQKSSSYCSQYQAVYNAMTNKPTAGIATAQNTMVQSLVTAGVWTKLDLFYCFAQYSNTVSEALLNWINPTGSFNATNISSTAWLSLEGFTGDGIADTLNTNYTPSTEGTNYTLNSASVGAYIRTNNTGSYDAIGVNSDARILLFPRNASGLFLGYLNDTLSDSYAVANGQGFYILSRTASTGFDFYKNGAWLYTGTPDSEAVPTSDIYILSQDGDNYFSIDQISVAFVGGGINGTEVTATSNAINTYMTSNTKNVY